MADVVIANNTILHHRRCAMRLFDDSTKGNEILECKNIRIQNNLVLGTRWSGDLAFFDHSRGIFDQCNPGDVPSLRKCSAWRISHNCREIDEDRARNGPDAISWIPACPHDRLQVAIEAGARKLNAVNFLRPPKGSPLATAGAGVEDKALPAYVGAVPPEGVEPWEWEKTWKALVR
jgi:hypothetical protein